MSTLGWSSSGRGVGTVRSPRRRKLELWDSYFYVFAITGIGIVIVFIVIVIVIVIIDTARSPRRKKLELWEFHIFNFLSSLFFWFLSLLTLQGGQLVDNWHCNCENFSYLQSLTFVIVVIIIVIAVIIVTIVIGTNKKMLIGIFHRCGSEWTPNSTVQLRFQSHSSETF